ncbi:MAG TPA: PA2778 family cysteine peptidase [Usitatibacter sp.]|nr:PA2778 family cysteine peptidase [Usitatibacter sp.]
MVQLIRARFANARLAAGVFICALLPGCALVIPQTSQLHDTWPEGLAQHAEVEGVPFFPQEELLCGPTALATALAAAGAHVTPGDLVASVYLPGRRGALQVEMLAAPRTRGFVSYRLEPRLEDVLREIAAGNAVVVLQDFGVWPFHLWHYAVAVGFDRDRGMVVMRSGTHERQAAPFGALEYTWKESGYWSMVVLPPGRVPVTANEARYLEAVAAAARVSGAKAAALAYEGLLERWPADVGAAVGLANVRYGSGDLAGAEKALRSGLERSPSATPLLNNLAQVLSDEGRNDEALRTIDAAQRAPGPFAAELAKTRDTILERMGKAAAK